MKLKIITSIFLVIVGIVLLSWLINLLSLLSGLLFGEVANGWAIITTAIFGGSISALAVYIAFMQANKLHLDTKLHIVKEKRHERKIAELEQIKTYIGDLITTSLHLHVIDKLSNIPTSKSDLVIRKQNMLKLHTFLEDNFNRIFASELFFNHVADVPMDCLERLFYGKRKALSDTYRGLYRILHDYLNFILNNCETLYNVNDCWIWELTERISETPTNTEFDENEPWTLINGVKTNINLTSTGIPVADTVLQRTNLLNLLNEQITQASQKEQSFMDEIQDLVLDIRVKLVEFVAVATDLENAILADKIVLINDISLEKQIEIYSKERDLTKI
ncbi:MAG: hypothetical protein FWG65_13280 [Turicibacter sp.]|nr:hypothetical protein [Turicibacter sp.]